MAGNFKCALDTSRLARAVSTGRPSRRYEVGTLGGSSIQSGTLVLS